MSLLSARLRVFCLAAAAVMLVLLTLQWSMMERRGAALESYGAAAEIAAMLGLSDLALSTEARYTRHPAASDGVVPFMDHPGAIEHFPSGSFFRPVRP